jgi:hypothetical protein
MRADDGVRSTGGFIDVFTASNKVELITTGALACSTHTQQPSIPVSVRHHHQTSTQIITRAANPRPTGGKFFIFPALFTPPRLQPQISGFTQIAPPPPTPQTNSRNFHLPACGRTFRAGDGDRRLPTRHISDRQAPNGDVVCIYVDKNSPRKRPGFLIPSPQLGHDGPGWVPST